MYVLPYGCCRTYWPLFTAFISLSSFCFFSPRRVCSRVLKFAWGFNKQKNKIWSKKKLGATFPLWGYFLSLKKNVQELPEFIFYPIPLTCCSQWEDKWSVMCARHGSKKRLHPKSLYGGIIFLNVHKWVPPRLVNNFLTPL